MDAATVTHRGDFHIPPDEATGGEQAYFAGNSLGLQPKGTAAVVKAELAKWAGRGVMGHFEGLLPWATCEDALAAPLAEIIGVPPELASLEVGAMNSLTVNLHLLMCAFYRPSEGRAAILIEAGAFPSDRYAVGSQIRHHGRDPAQWLIEVHPRASDGLLHTEDIISAIEANAGRLALVLLGGVNYLTGQVLDMAALSAHMHARNLAARADGRPIIPFGLDLAHAVGNVPLLLHEWQVDFAAWCSYKYLNSSPGGVAGLYVHERHHGPETFRLAGWWGHDKASRFKMPPEFVPERSAESWQWSNAPVLSMAAQRAALDVFDRADLDAYRAKSLEMTDVLLGLLDHVSAQTGQKIKVLTPREPEHRGSQVSVQFVGRDRRFFDYLVSRGVYADWREPGTVRMAVAPLYSSYRDLARLEALLAESLTQ
jgi:kynureninase